MKQSFFQILINETNKAILCQNSDGSFPSGHNGPYNDNETPVRNTAHWLFTLCHLYIKTNERKYVDAANKAIDYLFSHNARPMRGSFWVRRNPSKDFCNGVIGQAWVIEALVVAAEVLNRQECYDLAEELFLLHPWDEKKKIWQRVNVDGSFSTPDNTFNHQLWFGAVAGLLKNTKLAKKRSNEFFDVIAQNVNTYNNGVIFHASPLIKNKIFNGNIFETLRYLNQLRINIKVKKHLVLKSYGYHAFNLYAYAMYKEHLPKHPFWNSEVFQKMLTILDDEIFINMQIENPYSYPYNPTGIELAYVFEVFYPKNIEKSQWWLQQQVNTTYISGRSIMIRNSLDKQTSQARLYESARLKKDYQVSYD